MKRTRAGWSEASREAHRIAVQPAWSDERRSAHKLAMIDAASRPERNERLSAALKAKWASGTRRAIPMEAHKRAGKSIRRAYAEGRVKPRDSVKHQAGSSKGGKIGGVKSIPFLLAMAARKVGCRNPPGPSARGLSNVHAKLWAFRSPTGVHLTGRNLAHLIRENAEMFNPEDLEPRGKSGTGCQAHKGLASLVSHAGKGCSWKGWTPLPEIEPTIRILRSHKT